MRGTHMVETVNAPLRFQRGYETAQLVQRLAVLEEGELVTYSELTTLCGRNVRRDGAEGGKGFLSSARQIVERDHAVVTKAVSRTGIRRCTNSELALEVEDANARADRQIKRGVRRATMTDIERLD